MLTMSRSFPASMAGSGKLPCAPLPRPECGHSSRLWGLPKPRTLLGLYLATSRSCSETPRCCLSPGRDPCLGGCGTRALGEGTEPGRARSPPGAMVSDLRSSAYPSAAHGPLRPEQPY